MASIATVVTRGFGSFGSVNLLPTMGYGAGAGPVDSPATLEVGLEYSATFTSLHFEPQSPTEMSYLAAGGLLHFTAT